MPRRTRAASVTRFVLVLTACLLALILAAGWMVRQNIERTKTAATDIATRVMDAIQVRPKVVVNRRTVVEQQSDVLQLVTVEKTLTERQRIDESWLHSTKTLEVEADFVIRAGFDLAKPFVIEIDRSAGTLHVTLPPAEILGVELRDVRFPHDEDGIWNKLTGADREAAIRELRLRIQWNARQSDLRHEARIQAEKRLSSLLASEGRTVVFEPEKPR
jgi:hypothetical protein